MKRPGQVRAGVVAWMTMSYIAVVNPRILAEASAVTPEDPFPFRSVVRRASSSHIARPLAEKES